MKPLHWEKVRSSNLEDTVWMKLASGSVHGETTARIQSISENFELMFSATPSKSLRRSVSDVGTRPASGSRRASLSRSRSSDAVALLPSVLTVKRQQQLNIALSQFKRMTTYDICHALKMGSVKTAAAQETPPQTDQNRARALSVEQLSLLSNLMPTPEELVTMEATIEKHMVTLYGEANSPLSGPDAVLPSLLARMPRPDQLVLSVLAMFYPQGYKAAITIGSASVLEARDPNHTTKKRPTKRRTTRSLEAEKQKFQTSLDLCCSAKDRVSFLLLQEQWPNLRHGILENLSAVAGMAEELHHNHRLEEVLAMVLQLGNQMNFATGKGGAYGFRLSALSRLSLVKSNDGSCSFMSFVCKAFLEDATHIPASAAVSNSANATSKLREDKSDCCFTGNLEPLRQARKIDTEQLRRQISNLKRQFALVKRAIVSNDGVVAKGKTSPFRARMQTFYAEQSANCAALQTKFDDTLAACAKLAVYFGEKADAKPESLFGTFLDFATAFQRCTQDIQRTRDRERRQQRSLMSRRNSNSVSPTNTTTKLVQVQVADTKNTAVAANDKENALDQTNKQTPGLSRTRTKNAVRQSVLLR